MIRVVGLDKTFRDGERTVSVLRSLHLEIGRGRFVALLGRSGSGKSTLLNCVAGLERPDAGRIFLGDEEITHLPDADLTRLRRDRIGIVFQFFNLLPTLSVLDNVALPALLQGSPPGRAREKARDLLSRLGLQGRDQESPDHLSGGEQQRVATARALVNDPWILLADEPTGNLDARTGAQTLELFQRVNADLGVTILMATHSREAAATAGTVAALEGGRVRLP
jgi:putative ABC transport system ATP-binding protein